MNCDGIASSYEILERLCFGKALEQRRFAFLGETKTAKRAIVCGGGDGRFLARLLRVNSRVEIDFVDLSARMVTLAEQRVAGMGRPSRKRVRFHTGDVRSLEPPSVRYDLIVTHFFLDCFCYPELEDVVDRLASWGSPQARWLVSEFSEAEGPIAGTWSRAVIRGLYAGFQLTTGLRVTRLPPYKAALRKAGYLLRFEEEALGGLLHSSLWEVCGAQIGTAQNTRL